jgi:GGDEF domain-containing protein
MMAAIAATLAGVLANLFYLSPLNPSPWLDITTLGFLAGVVVLDRGILQHGLLNRIPVVRDRVVEQLKDPVLVITHQGTIIDANQSALEAWTQDESGLLDKPIESLMTHLSLSSLVDQVDNAVVNINENTFEIASTPLDKGNPGSDIALVFRDVTERLRAERKLLTAKNDLETMAHTDALTNMFNRRFFMQRLNEEFERIRRHNSILSVLIFDLDHFKRVNDGDKQGAIKLAHRLRHGIEDYPYADLLNIPLKVTASIGVATISKQSAQPENILKVADQALYEAKNGGRNMVCFSQA